jgi:hypothetical protein
LKSDGSVAIGIGSPRRADTSGAKVQIWHNGTIKAGCMDVGKYNFEITENGIMRVGLNEEGKYNFELDEAGAIHASNLYITRGELAGWKIDEKYLYTPIDFEGTEIYTTLKGDG